MPGVDILDDKIFFDPPGFDGPVEWGDPPDKLITQEQIGAQLDQLVEWTEEEHKGGPGSGNWGHTSRTRAGVGRGGSDPGGGLGAIGIGYGSTPDARRAMAERYRAGHAAAPAYQPFSTLEEATEWLRENEGWIGGMSFMYSITASPVQGVEAVLELGEHRAREAAATLRQMKELSPDQGQYAEAGIIFNRGGDNSYYHEHRDTFGPGGVATLQKSAVEIGLCGAGHSDETIRTRIEDLEMSIQIDGGNPYNTAQLARWQELQTFKETGRWQETYPHAQYMFESSTRASIVHESGHWVKDEIERGYMFSRREVENLSERYYSSRAERRQIGITQRGLDSFEEAFAENWSTYVAGKGHLVDPQMMAVFDVWTGQREWEEAWPQYAPKRG